MIKPKLLPTNHIALSGLLHDIGKFAERAQLKFPDHENRFLNQKNLLCPQWKGRYTHIHAAYTGLALDLLEQYFPKLIGNIMAPFAINNSAGADDCLVNAAAMHHKPETYLQWIIATADRIASGFEREEFEEYNEADEQNDKKGAYYHYRARLVTQFEQISINKKENNKNAYKYAYPLKALSPSALFPEERKLIEYTGSNEDINKAKAEYKVLWVEFVEALNEIPSSHRENLDLWLDHFDSCWLAFTQAIPSATAGKTIPDVSLYDHSKTTAALAAALWRYHNDLGHDSNLVKKDLATRTGSYGWDEEKFLIVQGDFFGIQDFVFAAGSETNRKAAKLLRGRSFSVSLLTDLAALKVLQKLELPATSQIVNAAGKFLMVAPNTSNTIKNILEVEKELNDWFLKNTYGQQGVGLAWQAASPNDFLSGNFNKLVNKLYKELEKTKFQRNKLCSDCCPQPIFENYLEQCGQRGVCVYNGKLPGELEFSQDKNSGISKFADDQIKIGEALTRKTHIVISSESILKFNSLQLDYFGYYIHFVNEEMNLSYAVKSENIVRIWDFSNSDTMDETVFNGYARRFINTYVPEFNSEETEKATWNSAKYGEWDSEVDYNSVRKIKVFDHIACEDKTPIDKDDTEITKWVGVTALSILKGDIDNLGTIFQRGLVKPTFAKWAALSRQVNAFFTIYSPVLFKTKKDGNDFSNTYTVFAGGDDFFLIGPWLSMQRLANEMRKAFSCYTVNPQITFSAGISFAKPGEMIHSFAEIAEQNLDNAKKYEDKTGIKKNAVHVWGKSMNWDDFDILLKKTYELEEYQQKYNLSHGYMYGLLRFADMVNSVKIEDTIWRARFNYQTVRSVNEMEDAKRLIENIGNDLKTYAANYRVAVHNHLYKQRNS